MADLTFRPATGKDHDALLRFVTAMALESDGQHLDPDTVSRGLHEALDRPAHRQYYLVEGEGRPIGCCLITTEWSDWTARWYWWFQSVYVVPEQRGAPLRVWERMYAWIQARARDAGVEKLLLYTHRNNRRAHRAYEKAGMKRTDQVIYGAPTRSA